MLMSPIWWWSGFLHLYFLSQLTAHYQPFLQWFWPVKEFGKVGLHLSVNYFPENHQNDVYLSTLSYILWKVYNNFTFCLMGEIRLAAVVRRYFSMFTLFEECLLRCTWFGFFCLIFIWLFWTLNSSSNFQIDDIVWKESVLKCSAVILRSMFEL